MKKLKLDLGCGTNKQKGFIGVDFAPLRGVDIRMDLEKYPWRRFKTGCVSEVYMSHFAEHISDFNRFFAEVWRVCAHNATVTVVVPYLHSDRAFQDPTHKQFISEHRWAYLNRDWREANGLNHKPYLTREHFVGERLDFTFMDPKWKALSQDALHDALAHKWNVAADMLTVLRVKKGGRSR